MELLQFYYSPMRLCWRSALSSLRRFIIAEKLLSARNLQRILGKPLNIFLKGEAIFSPNLGCSQSLEPALRDARQSDKCCGFY